MSQWYTEYTESYTLCLHVQQERLFTTCLHVTVHQLQVRTLLTLVTWCMVVMSCL